MLTLSRRSLLQSRPSTTNAVALDIKRQASLTGAISRGIRKSQDSFGAPPRRWRDDDPRKSSHSGRIAARSYERRSDHHSPHALDGREGGRPSTTTWEVNFSEQRGRDDRSDQSHAKPSPYRQRREARLRQHFAKDKGEGQLTAGRDASVQKQETLGGQRGTDDEKPSEGRYGTRNLDKYSGRTRDRDEPSRDQADDYFDDLDSRGKIRTRGGSRHLQRRFYDRNDREVVSSKPSDGQPRRRYDAMPREEKESFHTRHGMRMRMDKRLRRGEKAHSPDGGRWAAFSQHSVVAPRSIPYTTAGSEFLYGTFAVKAAIQAGRRKLHKLYVWRGEESSSESTDHESPVGIHKLALAAGVRVHPVEGLSWNTLLLKMSSQRPYNGLVLEAAPLPRLPVTSLSAMDKPSAQLQAMLDHQTAEQLEANHAFTMSDSVAKIDCVDSNRYPLVLFLDRIVDPGNLGAIIRSAYYLGVDAIVVLEFGTSPFSAVTLKASSGAAEYLPILTVKNEHKFIKASKQNGWKFFTAVAPGGGAGSGKTEKADVQSALATAPTVLMLGSEGEGLRGHLLKLADGVANIPSGRQQIPGLDSLNVSVAAALLAQEFLKSPGSHMTDGAVKLEHQHGHADDVEGVEKVF